MHYNSKQREIILNTLQKNVIHPTADQVYALLHKEYPTISLATVYRNLNQLAEMNVIRKITELNGSCRFDHNTHKHYHFICSKCNKVYDVPHECMPELTTKVEAEIGVKVETCDVSFRGVCFDCINKN